MKKRLLSIILALSMVLAICPTLFLTAPKVHAAGTIQGGGTEASPFLIDEAEDFETIYAARSNKTYNDKYLKLTADLDLTGKTPPRAGGWLWTNEGGFAGHFDGDGHTIKGLTCPFISIVEQNTVIAKITANISGVTGATWQASPYNNLKNCSVKNLHLEGDITGYGSLVGFVRFMEIWPETHLIFSVSDCSFKGTVTNSSSEATGGLIGCAGQSSSNCSVNLTRCWVKGEVKRIDNSNTSGQGVGGLIGSCQTGLSMNQCYFSGIVSESGKNTNSMVSGLAVISRQSEATPTYGKNIKAGSSILPNNYTIKDCYSAASLTGSQTAGIAYVYFSSGTDTSGRYKAYRMGSISESYSYVDEYTYPIAFNMGNSLQDADIASNIYYLMPTHTDAVYGVTGLTKKEFAKRANFDGFDFTDTWVMNAPLGRPVLQAVQLVEEPDSPAPDIPENIDAKAEVGDPAEIDLAEYIKSTGGEDLSGQYTYTIDEEGNEPIMGMVYDYEKGEMTEGVTGYLAEVDGTKVTFDSSASIGEHKVTVKGTYIGEEADGILGETADDIEFTITETVTKTVPAPVPSTYTFPYSSGMRLKYISLNDAWQWEKPETLPRDNASYEVIYPVEEGMEDYYKYSDIEDAVYDASKGGIISSVKLYVTESEETPYKITVTVKNADNNKPIEGAAVSSTFDYEFTNPSTDSNGQAVGEMTAGTHTIYAEKEYFVRNSAVTNVQNNSANTATVTLTPERVNATLPKLYSDGSAVNSTATITKLNYDTDPAYEWNNKSATASYKGGSVQPLPTGKYSVSLSAYGYRSTTVYMTVDYPNVVKYYSDNSFSDDKEIDPEKLSEVINSTKLGDAAYTIDFTKQETDGTVTATVKLKNIAVTSGTVGLRYDPDLFSFDPGGADLSLNTDKDIKLVSTPETQYKNIAEDIPAWDTSMGYYVFRWSVGNESTVEGAKKVLDTEVDEALIATFVFKLKDEAEWDEVSNDTFGIMPWTETEEAIAYKKWYDKTYANTPAAGDYEFETYWRPVDADNSAYSLGVGRIEDSKTVVNNIDTGGFFQASVNNDLGSEDLVSFYDIMSVVNMFETNITSLRFTVTDAESGEPIEGAKVMLYPADETAAQSNDTNAKGIARFPVDTTADYVVNYTYTVSLNGYWPVDKTPVSVQPKVAKNVEVKLTKKIYHEPKVVSDTVEIVGDLDLGGERLGYNGQDFHFRAKAKPGYTLNEDGYPETATVTIGEYGKPDYVQVTLERDEKQNIFKLEAKYLKQAELTKAELAALYGDEEGRTENDYEQPDADGFRSYNIEIKFGEYTTAEKPIEVRGIAGTHGTVAYDSTHEYETEVTGLAASETKSAPDKEYVVDGILPSDNEKNQTGTFTFKGNEEDDVQYTVEKVFINGVQTHDYDNLVKFEYSFGKPTMDSSIAVIFWDGINPSDDSVITLIVGDYGSVKVTKPAEEEGVRQTTRTYLNPDPDLIFTTVPDTGYQLYSIKTQIDDGAIEAESLSGLDLKSQTDNSFSFEPVSGHNKKIFVTFKNPAAPKTPTIFVKSYVERGNGTIDPFGLLVYNIYDTVKLDLASGAGYDIWGVKVSPLGKSSEGVEQAFSNLADKSAYTYIIDSIEEDTEVGAIFEEHKYLVKGAVDLSQGIALDNSPWNTTGNTNVLSGATVTFVRTAALNGLELDDKMTVKTVTTADRTNASFGVEIPVGIWTITVSKQGYVNYIITDYRFTANTEELVGNAYFDFSSQKIVPLIGSTRDGKAVSVWDIAGVRSGLRENLNDTAKAKADVDNNGTVDVTDISFILKNFGARTTYMPFSEFDK